MNVRWKEVERINREEEGEEKEVVSRTRRHKPQSLSAHLHVFVSALKD